MYLVFCPIILRVNLVISSTEHPKGKEGYYTYKLTSAITGWVSVFSCHRLVVSWNLQRATYFLVHMYNVSLSLSLFRVLLLRTILHIKKQNGKRMCISSLLTIYISTSENPTCRQFTNEEFRCKIGYVWGGGGHFHWRPNQIRKGVSKSGVGMKTLSQCYHGFAALPE